MPVDAMPLTAIKAWRTHGRGGLHQVDEALPRLGPHDVRVGITAVALNFRDVPFVRGRAERPPVAGRIPCSDAVGRVLEVGPAVTRLRVGERVASTILPRWLSGPLSAAAFDGALGSAAEDGVLAQQRVLDEQAWVHPPATLDDVQACTLPCAALTAWHAIVEIAALRAGETVVIETTGGVSLFCLQFARALGARTIVTSRSADNLARALALGADAAIDTRAHPDWHHRVAALTGGAGAALVVDMGLPDGLARSCEAAAFEGTVAVVGVVGGWQAGLPIGPVMNKNLRVRGVETGSREMFERMNRFIDAHGMSPVIGSTFGFDDAPLAFDAQAASPFGKVVVTL